MFVAELFEELLRPVWWHTEAAFPRQGWRCCRWWTKVQGSCVALHGCLGCCTARCDHFILDYKIYKMLVTSIF